MDYGQLFRTAWDRLLARRYLIGLGLLVALASGQIYGGEAVLAYVLGSLPIDVPGVPRAQPLFQFSDEQAAALLMAGPGALLGYLAAGFAAVSLVITVLGTLWIVGEGALAYGASTQAAGLGQVLGQAWRRAWALLVVASIPAIPVTVGLILVMILLLITGRLMQAAGIGLVGPEAAPWIVSFLLGSAIIMVPLSVITTLLAAFRPLAERACVLEGLRAEASFLRAWERVKADPAPFVLVFGAQLLGGSVLAALLTPLRYGTGWCAAIYLPLAAVLALETAYFAALWTAVWEQAAPQGEGTSAS